MPRGVGLKGVPAEPHPSSKVTFVTRLLSAVPPVGCIGICKGTLVIWAENMTTLGKSLQCVEITEGINIIALSKCEDAACRSFTELFPRLIITRNSMYRHFRAANSGKILRGRYRAKSPSHASIPGSMKILLPYEHIKSCSMLSANALCEKVTAAAW